MGRSVVITDAKDIRTLLRKALEEKRLNAVLGLFSQPPGDTLALRITSDPGELDKLEPVAPVMPVQAARVISNIKFTETDLAVACIVKPCEMRASVELIKLKQIMADRLLFISMDCGGSLEPVDFRERKVAGKNPVAELAEMSRNFDDFSQRTERPRTACRMCDKFIPQLADLRIRTFGAVVCIEAGSEKGEQFLRESGLDTESRDFSEYDAKIAKIRDKRLSVRSEERQKFGSVVGSMADFVNELSACIRCHNCMINCPVCYCKECIFRSPVFDHPAGNFETWLKRKGSVRLPADTTLFHITRVNHMGTSCVSCGQCESVCPVGIKLTRIFSFIGEDIQKIFDYEPGRSLAEELPVSTFREKELEKI